MKKILLLCSCVVISILFLQAQPRQVVPTKTQLIWHDMEFYLFMHFGPNTFTEREWGLGNEKEDEFNPANLNCDQWCKTAKGAGATGIIITAKHHDGFCLWPSKFSTHTVKESKWKNGKGDVLKELSEACKANGIKFGIYISPWDRNHPKYGTPAYNDVFVGMMEELFKNYGPIWELWWDGANGEGPNGKKQEYDWKRFIKTVRTLSPNTLLFSDIGPDIRWVGNERGIAGITNWNLLDTAGFKPGLGAPSTDTLNSGNVYGSAWIPAECDVSIRKGWFYHASEDGTVKSPEQLFQLYLKSVGRGADLLLNVPPDGNGRINKKDSMAMAGFKKLKEESFAHNLAKQADVTSKSRTNKSADHKTSLSSFLVFKEPVEANCIVLKENIAEGQLIKKVDIILSNHGMEVKKIAVTTVGHKRIITFPAEKITEIAIVVNEAKAKPKLSAIELYHISENLIEQ
jgi:alpha-L-fucosidase